MSAPATTDPVHTLYVDHGKWLHGWLRRKLGNDWLRNVRGVGYKLEADT